MQVVVVGAGLGGLSAACHLRGAGHDVVVLERGDRPGGRAGVLERGGYRFDTGPTVFTMPGLLRDCFDALGTSMEDHLTLKAVDPMYRGVFADGSELRVWGDHDRMVEEIRTVCGPAEADGFVRFARWLRQLFEVEHGRFIDTNFDSPLDLVRPLKPAIELVRLRGFSTVARRLSHFFGDERLHRIFGFQSMYAGLAPHQALAIYSVITYMDAIEGVSFPEGGMAAVPEALAGAATRGGVELRYDSPVERIVLAGGSTGPVRGVLVDGELVEADAVVCNADLPVAYRTLLPGLPQPRAVRKGTYSPSCVVWHAGVSGTPGPEVAHHNIHFGHQWRRSFEAILHEGVPMPDPSILVTVASLDDPGAAPEGCSALYVLEPVPNLDGSVDWTVESDRLRRDLAERVANLGYPAEVEVSELVDPLGWERMGMERGTPFALSHRFLQTGPFRPANVTRHAPGLVFVGSSTVPGVGVPMVLISGRLAAERVERLTGGTRR